MWEFIGQDRAIQFLERSRAAGMLANAYLLVGPRHVGKTTLAINMAQAVNCVEASPPCGECPSCRRIAAGIHADVQIIAIEETDGRAKKEISIDQIRALQRAASLKPFEGRSRVFIISEAEALSLEAANCLLKTLEEPPPQVYLILLTAEEEKLLPTLVSRCQRLELNCCAPQVLEKALVERWGVAAGEAQVLARVSQGRVGWAVAAAQGSEEPRQRRALLERLAAMPHAGYGERFELAADWAEQFGKNRQGIHQALRLWVGWWRDILLMRSGGKDLITNVDYLPVLASEAEGYTSEQIASFLGAIVATSRYLEQNVNPRLALEALLLALPARAGPSSSPRTHKSQRKEGAPQLSQIGALD